MGQHGPKTAQGLGWNDNAELGDIAFEKGADKSLPPLVAVCVVVGQESPRKAAPQPQSVSYFHTDLLKTETLKLVIENPAGQGFGRLTQQF